MKMTENGMLGMNSGYLTNDLWVTSTIIICFDNMGITHDFIYAVV